MSTYVAFVRAVMIGREGLHRKVLLDMFGRAGASDAVSYISTGNVSFTLQRESVDDLIASIEHELRVLLGRPTPIFVRSLAELLDIHRGDPFSRSPYPEPAERTVVFFRDRVPAALTLPLVSARGDFHVFEAGPREVYAVGRDIEGRRQAPGGVVERTAGEPATSRAWSTIDRIVEKLTS